MHQKERERKEEHLVLDKRLRALYKADERERPLKGKGRFANSTLNAKEEALYR